MTDIIGMPYAETRRRINAAFLFCEIYGGLPPALISGAYGLYV